MYLDNPLQLKSEKYAYKMRNSINIVLYLDFLGKCTTVVFLLSREKVTVELGTAISVSARYFRLFDVYGILCFFRRIELKHVALPVESDLPMSTVSVRPSVPPDH